MVEMMEKEDLKMRGIEESTVETAPAQMLIRRYAAMLRRGYAAMLR